MARIEISGYSDDLIEIDGDISEEFNAYGDDEGPLLAFSDGTVLRITYGDAGIWRIVPVKTGSGELFITQAPEDDGDNYSDKAVLTGDVKWVVRGLEMAS